MTEPRSARGPDEWPLTAKVILGVAYVIIAVFLCLAAIQDPDLDDGKQWVWYAVAVAWGPIFLFFWVLLGGEVPGDRRD